MNKKITIEEVNEFIAKYKEKLEHKALAVYGKEAEPRTKASVYGIGHTMSTSPTHPFIAVNLAFDGGGRISSKGHLISTVEPTYLKTYRTEELTFEEIEKELDERTSGFKLVSGRIVFDGAATPSSCTDVIEMFEYRKNRIVCVEKSGLRGDFFIVFMTDSSIREKNRSRQSFYYSVNFRFIFQLLFGYDQEAFKVIHRKYKDDIEDIILKVASGIEVDENAKPSKSLSKIYEELFVGVREIHNKVTKDGKISEDRKKCTSLEGGISFNEIFAKATEVVYESYLYEGGEISSQPITNSILSDVSLRVEVLIKRRTEGGIMAFESVPVEVKHKDYVMNSTERFLQFLDDISATSKFISETLLAKKKLKITRN